MATTYVVTGVDRGVPRLPNDSVIAGLRVGDTFTSTLDAGVEAELIAAGLIAKSPVPSPVSMLPDGSLAAADGRPVSGGSASQFIQIGTNNPGPLTVPPNTPTDVAPLIDPTDFANDIWNSSAGPGVVPAGWELQGTANSGLTGITVPTAGLYFVTFTIGWDSSTDGNRILRASAGNPGTTVQAVAAAAVIASLFSSEQASGIVAMSAPGDILPFWRVESTASADVTATYAEVDIYYLGPIRPG